MRLSISEMTTYRWAFDQDIQEFSNSENNVSAIGVWRQKLDDFGIDEGTVLVNKSGIEVSSLSWAGGFTGAEVRTYREAIDDGLDAIRLAAALGAGCLIVHTGPRAGHTRNHAWRLAVQAFEELAESAGSYGVTLAIEPMRTCCADMWTFLTDIDTALRLIDDVRQSEVKLVYDTYHLACDQFDPRQIARVASQTALVQLSDSAKVCSQSNVRSNEPSRCFPGMANVSAVSNAPLAEVVEAFETNGYQGFYEVEVFGPAVEDRDYCQMLHDCQKVYDGFGVANSRQTSRS